jgi:FMN phosphatase YigB (HAD superfamily)
MLLGIDFDNTLIDYDDVFLTLARERELIDNSVQGSKRAVRDAVRQLPNGEIAWQQLQGYVYGAGIARARLFEGAHETLLRCRAQGVPVFIISHKTRYGHHDPYRIDLREAALDWLEHRGFFATRPSLVPVENVRFADDRAAKLRWIGELGCTHYIDDLEEVFADLSFPAGVKRILFSTISSPHADVVCSHWNAIAAAIFGDT